MENDGIISDLLNALSDFFRLELSNYFWWLTGISLFFWLLEIMIPWRKNQAVIRKDFWLDLFYGYFNMFILPIAGLSLMSELINAHLMVFLQNIGIQRLDVINLAGLPAGVQLFLLFLIRDFVHFNIHRLLHRIPWMWEFHKIHHSVKEMGFAAHLRFHWIEGLIYRILEYIPLALLGFSVTDFMIVYLFSLAVGHSNHSNYYLPLSKMKYILNNPQMHIWHHEKNLPFKYGVNFGLTLSIWDYLFQTAYIPGDGRDNELGFPGEEHFPGKFPGQFIYPVSFRKKSDK